MLKDELAEVYQGGGAVYGSKGLERYLELQEEAKKTKVGIWSIDNRESAAEYKKSTK
jgi:endonuclease YncB( thermonuclease family)